MFVLRSNNSGFSLHIVLMVLASIAGVAILGWFTQNQTAISKEKKQFIAAQTEVNALGDKLTKATSPDKHEAIAYCSYSSAKYGKGSRFCWVKYYLMYLDTDKESALIKFKEIERIVAEKHRYTVKDSKYLSSIKNLAFKSSTEPKCGVAIYFNENDNPSTGSPSYDQPKNSALVEIDCSGEAKAEHFPVKE